MKWFLNYNKENVPKKYVVSRHHINMAILGICSMIFFVTPLWGLAMYFGATPDALRLLPIFYTIGCICVLAFVVVLLFDVPSFRFSVSEDGITMYIRHKKYLIYWDNIVHWDMLGFEVSIKNPNRIYWLCFSTRHLTQKEMNGFTKIQLVGSGIGKVLLKNRGTLAMFQCGAKTYSEIRQYFPADIRDEFDQNFGILDGMMTRKERRLNK